MCDKIITTCNDIPMKIIAIHIFKKNYFQPKCEQLRGNHQPSKKLIC